VFVFQSCPPRRTVLVGGLKTTPLGKKKETFMNPATIGKVLKEVLKWGPVIAETAKKIYDNIKKMRKESPQKESSTTITLDDLNKKISLLEQNDLDQAKLLSEMGQQNNNLSKLVNVLATITLYAIIIAGISLIITIYLLIRFIN